MNHYEITTGFGRRIWHADDIVHAIEQHFDAFGDAPQESIESVEMLSCCETDMPECCVT